jgi:hypothetical protein
LDIVTANRGAASVSVLRGLPGGVFAPKTDIAVGSTMWDVGAEDMTADGNVDLLVGRYGALSVFPGVGDGTFLSPTNTPVRSAADTLKVADMDGDGKPDVVITDKDGGTFGMPYVVVYLGDGAGGMSNWHAYSTPNGGPDQPVAIADFNLDGEPDVIREKLFLGNGDGTLQAPLNVPFGGSPLDMAASDVDGDGRPDARTAMAAAASPAGNILE